MLLRGKNRNSLQQLRVLIGRQPIRVFIVCLTILVLVGILYFNSLGNQFTNWDDGMIYQNPSIRNLNWDGIKKIFTLEKGNTFQPIRVLSYAIDYHFWKLNPLGYHLTSIFFYFLTCMMIFLTLRQLSGHLRDGATPDSHQRVAFFGALLFVAHPVHVEAVTWLAARKEVLQGLFFFLAFYFYLKGEGMGKKRIIYLGLVLFSVLLAILSKPSAVIFPGIIILYEIAREKGKLVNFIRRHWVFLTTSIVISGFFTYILMKVMLEAGGIKPYIGGGLLSNLLASLYAFLWNLKLLFATVNYSAAYSFSISLPVFCPKNIVYMLFALFLFIISMVSLRWTKVIFFSFSFFLISVLPYLNIIPISTLLADRYVFIASFSYVFLLGIVFDRLYVWRHRRFSEGFFKLLSVALFLFLLAGYSLMTIQQNKIWQNSYTLWADAVEKYPESSAANALMGVVYMELGMDQDSVKYLEKAVQLIPYDYMSRNNLGIVYGRLDEPEKALKEFATAMQLRPDDDSIKINLSVFYQRQKYYKKAEEVLKYLLAKNPQNANLHFRLGLVYKEMGQYEAAISEMLKSIEVAPHNINPYEELGNIYVSKLKDVEKAKYYYSKGIEMAPKAKSKAENLRWMIQDLECHQ
jgi:tetratricopeptide (TPR) repeat protein